MLNMLVIKTKHHYSNLNFNLSIQLSFFRSKKKFKIHNLFLLDTKMLETDNE